jgi:DNA-binding CsgD family transcriptional regulator
MSNTSLYRTLPSLISSIGERYFYDRVACSIQDLGPISNARIISYPKTGQPTFLDGDTMSEIDKLYCESAYLLDPIYDVLYYKKHNELVTLDSVVNDDFCDSIYYDTFYQRLGLSNETNIVIGTNDDTKICIVYTTKDNYLTQQAASKELDTYLESIKSAILTHERIGGLVQQKQTAGYAGLDYNHNRHTRFDSTNLTKREKEVVELILDGLSSAAIAEKCFVSTGTIKNHRKNIYRKLGISSQAELFHNFLQ